MSRNKVFHKTSLATAVAATTLLSGQATQVSAQTLMEEVLVTATARSQSVQEIPYNISAMLGDDMDAMNITSEAELLRAMSGVSVIDRGYRNSGTVNSIIIRGLNVDSGANGDIALSAVPTVSTYVDNTPLYANFVLRDIERVEVLRGPQGTLYGSGALGGTVRYISKKPSFEEFSGDVKADFSQTDGSEGENISFDAVFNIPVSDSFAIRASAGRIDNDGVIDYVNAYRLNAAGEPLIDDGAGGCVSPGDASPNQAANHGACYVEREDADTVEIDYQKIAAAFQPSDSLSILLSYQHQEDEIGGRRSVALGGDYDYTNGNPGGIKYGDDDNGTVLVEPSSREVDLFSLDIEADLGFATLTSNTSYYEHEGVGESDNGGLWVSGGRDWVNAYYPGYARPAQRAERGYNDEATIQELRLVSNDSDSAMDWLAGVYYMDQEQYVFQNSWNDGMSAQADACAFSSTCTDSGYWMQWYAGDITERDLEYARDVEYTELAIYGELTFNISDSFRATLGARYFDAETTTNAVMGFPTVGAWTAWATVPVDETKESDDDILLKGNLSYDLNDSAMLYGTISEGYRRGGSNAVPNSGTFAEPNAEAAYFFGKDTVTNFEVGVKGQTDSFSYTVSAFYVDWQDPQLNATTSWFAFYMGANGDSAETMGLEVELEGYLTETLHYRVGYTHVQAELTGDFLHPQDDSVIAEDGAQLPGTPENVLSLGIDNTWSLSSGMDLVARASIYYQSESENFIDDTSVLHETHDSFSLINASASLVADNWTITLYGKNLGNEEGVTGSFPSAYFGTDTGIDEGWKGNANRQMISQPRTIGLTAAYRF